MTDYITPKQFRESDGVDDWRVIGDGTCTFYPVASLAQAARLVQAIADLPGAEDHRPDIDVRSDGVTVRLLTQSADWYGTSLRDVDMARKISAAARELGLVAEPQSVQSMIIVPAAANTAEVMPFWQAVLGYERRADSAEEDLVDPHNRNPGFWFEQMREMRGDGGGAIHIGVWVPMEQAKARVEAALAAGGRMVRDDYAPAWWTLADAAGNEADIATVETRD